MYFVYILQSLKDGSYYVGSTKNIEERLLRHNSGSSGYTKSKKPWKLIHIEVFQERKEALKREKEIKKKKKRRYIEQLIRTSRL